MNSHQPFPEDEPVSIAAIILSIIVHGGLLAALFFGVQWKSEQPGGTPVAVYFGNPAASTQPPPPPPPPAKVETPEPPKVEAKPTPKPEVRAEGKPQIDPQIAIKDKERKEKEEKARLEKERIEQEKIDKLKKQKAEEEQKQKEAKEQARKEEEDRQKREKQAADEKRAEDARKEADREAKQMQQNRANAARAEQMARLNAELEGAHGSPTGSANGTSSGARSGGVGGDDSGKSAYQDAISRKIRGNTILPPGIQGNPEALFEVTQLPTGEVMSVKLLKSTGNGALDTAIERAINKSSPLPQPKNPKWFDRTLKLKYKPFEE